MIKQKSFLVTILVLCFALTASAAYASLTFSDNAITSADAIRFGPDESALPAAVQDWVVPYGKIGVVAPEGLGIGVEAAHVGDEGAIQAVAMIDSPGGQSGAALWGTGIAGGAGGTTAYGLVAEAYIDDDATNNPGMAAGLFRVGGSSIAPASNGIGVWVLGATDTANINTLIGLDIQNQIGATDNYAIRTGLGKVKFGDTLQQFKGANIASAGTMTLTGGNVFHVTGTTNITTLNTCDSSNAGRFVTLIFDGILTFTDGNNLKLNTNFVTSADDTISLVCDGSSWFETGRATN